MAGVNAQGEEASQHGQRGQQDDTDPAKTYITASSTTTDLDNLIKCYRQYYRIYEYGVQETGHG